MGFAETLLLGVIAGATILLGLPIARLRRPAPTLRLFLNAAAVGVLIFLLWDVLAHAWEPVDVALAHVHDGSAGIAPAIGYGALFLSGLTAGMLALVFYETALGRAKQQTFGPGAAAAGELSQPRRLPEMTSARRLSMMIAVGIGLHNFAEGLAIGQSAATGDISLAAVLVVGFGLHNATEGFGIVAPLAASQQASGTGEDARPDWSFLLLLGLIGGGPTFVGTAVGHSFTSAQLSVAFLTLAAGSILYVVVTLLGVAAKAKLPRILAYGLLVGLAAGFLTDAIVTAGGG